MNTLVIIALIVAGVIVLGIVIYALIAAFAFKTVRKAQKEMFDKFTDFHDFGRGE